MLNKGSRVLPVAETETVMVGTTSQVKDNTQDDETGDGYDLDRADIYDELICHVRAAG